MFCLLLASAGNLQAANYYVDYAGGNDDADGASSANAWKHCPGDANARGKPASAELKPGDTILFKGGVRYFGEIDITVSGSAARPIIFDGNSTGAFGDGPAVLDGAKMITGWNPVDSPSLVANNPRWEDIFYADLEIDLSSNFNEDQFILHRDGKPDRQAPWQRVFLIDGTTRVLPVAQDPKPEDPFFPDLPGGFFTSNRRLGSSYPHRVYYEAGSKGNRTLPLMAITYGGNAPVIEPFNGGAVSVDLDEPTSVAEIGFKLFRPKSYPAPETIAFLADDKEICRVDVNADETELQRFRLPATVRARKLTFRLQHSGSDIRGWTKLQQLAAFAPDGANLLKHDIFSIITDDERLTRPDAEWYDDQFVGVHGGNNHVYFARVKRYDPAAHQLRVPHFSATTYNETRYAFFNSPRLISLPGEWALVPLKGGRTRVFLLPEKLENGRPVNIGYPVLKTAMTIAGDVSHIEVRGFLMQRYSGGKGGVTTVGKGAARPSHIRIADCEIRFMSGQSGISLNHSDHITVENCNVHHCPGWTVGIYVNRINDYQLLSNRIDYNSGSGIRHYEAKRGILKDNVVLNHYGMHSSGLNFYEGCADILFEGNYVQNVIAINRSAQDLTFRNNVVDSQDRNAVSVAMWCSGRVGGTFIKNLTFENNTLVNTDEDLNWSTAIFVQRGPSVPEGLVIRDNILDRLRPPVPGVIERNIFIHETDESVAGSGSLTVNDAAALFRDPSSGDFRRKKVGPMPNVGASVSPPNTRE